MQATIVVTRRVKHGADFRGGLTRYAKVRNDLNHLLRDSDAAVVTTLFDYYALPGDFPGMATRPAADALARVKHVQAAFAADVGEPRFRPFIALHELEALVFSDPEPAAWALPSGANISEILRIRDEAGGPEAINEGPETAPSKRLARLAPGYDKVTHGPLALASMGLAAIRARCPHFSGWIADLEAIAGR
ncbi:MAG: DUF4276 family protein [bacterium]